MKKTGWIILGTVLVLVVMLFSAFIGTYNNLQVMDENVNSNWAQVDNQLKRRNDLIPNLVATVKGYAAHETATFLMLYQGCFWLWKDILSSKPTNSLSICKTSWQEPKTGWL